MLYLLDTNYLSELRKPRPNAGVLAWSLANNSAVLAISVATVCEVRFGIEELRLADPLHARVLDKWLAGILTEFAETILPVTIEIADAWGKLGALLNRKNLDTLIAATALEHDLTVVTRNVADFEKTGVRIVNPWR